MKFVDITNDIAFRKIFGNDSKKKSLISFLNAVIDLPESISADTRCWILRPKNKLYKTLNLILLSCLNFTKQLTN